MDYSKLFVETLREDPAEAEVISHKLMYRAGLIRKLAAGIYNYMPAGLRSLRKIENIIREEMDRAGAQEVLMPAVQPAELWQESGRWDYYGKELLRFRDRHGRDYCMGPTHEEVITDLVRSVVRSYRQLPVNLYQIQTKFRDEIRPRFGVMRSREFIMKDAYSFDTDNAGAEESYRLMKEAYNNIFRRCGLKFVAVEADSGAIGGSFSHEFMVLAQSGEDAIAACECGYGANVEKAEVTHDGAEADSSKAPAREFVATPNVRTIDEVCAFFKVSPAEVAKTLIFATDAVGAPLVAVCVRGDHDANPAKVKNLVGANYAELATEEQVREATCAPSGFAGPCGIKVPVYFDRALRGLSHFISGANQPDAHYKNLVAGRDFTVEGWADLRFILAGDPCPRCGKTITVARGIEVGHIFKLGTKYSEKLKATFLDASGKDVEIVMGCYGIGVGRTLASAIEQNYDENGIVWPVPIAPWEVIILPVQVKDEESMRVAREIESALVKSGVEVLFDDRDERAGVKFKDADLLGIPLRITIGSKGLKEGVVEVKERAGGAEAKMAIGEVAAYASKWVAERKA
ncbi:proline--tRNA ligase [bacterium]|nr:MAG: proline--tRNA ligase [bacterium]